MVAKKPKVVIIGAGMAGLTAAHKLFTTPGSRDLFELSVVEGGTRIGGRINTSEFGGGRIEMGATWIHGIIGSPVYKIAEEISALESEQPWECMDGFSDEKMEVAETIAEGGLVVNPSIVEPISSLFDKLMEIAQCKLVVEIDGIQKNVLGGVVCASAAGKQLSLGSFLRQGLQAYWESKKGSQKEEEEEVMTSDGGDWNVKLLEEAIFAMFENTQRTYTGAGDLYDLDYAAESEYRMFPGEEITIPRGYTSVIEALASALPAGLIQLGKKVVRIQWLPNDAGGSDWLDKSENNHDDDGVFRSVKLHFNDGSMMLADHVIVTVSLGVLKAGIQQHDSSSGLFSPPLPDFKTEAISRLGYGVVNKLFLKLSGNSDNRDGSNKHSHAKFPYMQMAFHRLKSEYRHQKIPWWMRRTSSLYPIYGNSSVLLCWFAGKEALELENLEDEEIMDGVSRTVSSFLHSCPQTHKNSSSDDQELYCNGNVGCSDGSGYNTNNKKFSKILRSKWGTDPLFLGSYSYVAVGSSGDDLDIMAEPLPRSSDILKNSADGSASSITANNSNLPPPLQILFAGEATHRTHYSTTHGAYFSGLREANRLLQHYSSSVGAVLHY